MAIARFIKDGVIMDITHLQKFLKKYLGETTTFLENYEKTGWILNISVSSIHQKDTPRLLNYITTPNILIWSAASASWAIPNVFAPVELLSKNDKGEVVPYTATKNHKFIDGSVKADLPMQRLSEIFNVNTFFVSQVNPMIVPFITDDGGGILGTNAPLYKRAKSLILNEMSHIFNLFTSLGLIPGQLDKLPFLMSQNYKGHVTVSPNIRLMDFMNLLRNPTPEYVQQAIVKAEKYTYPKISIIKSIFEIEREIHTLAVKCKSQLDKEKFGFVLNAELKSNVGYNEYGVEYDTIDDFGLKSVSSGIDLANIDPEFESKRKHSDDFKEDKATKKQKKGLRKVTSHENVLKIRYFKTKQGQNPQVNPSQQPMTSQFLHPNGNLASVKSHESLYTIVSDYVEEADEMNQYKNEISQRAAIWNSKNNSEASDN